jgi:hypothetical protein
MNKRLISSAFESLEERRYLTVDVSVSDDGDLVVVGDADGAVAITAVDAGTFEVTDNGVVVATVEGVTDDIRIRLAGEGEGADDQVTVNLGEQAVDIVYANLGEGDNSLIVGGGTVERGLFYWGGDGNDAVEIDSTVERCLSVSLGDGDNTVSLAGSLGSVSLRGGDGNDAVTVTASITGSLQASLGDGENSLSVAGAVEGSVRYRGGEGNDAVTIAESASVGGNVLAKLGGGENSLTHAGTTEGDLIVRSSNEEDADRITVAEGSVGGETSIGAGEQMDGFFGRHGGCRGFLGFGRGGFRGFRR